ncbi:MAG: agmatine deiminase family protein [Oligoflexus sp.]
MRGILGAVLLAFSLPVAGQSQEILPNWASPAELAFTKDLRNIPFVREEIRDLPEGFRIPAEFEPIDSVVMTYSGYGSFLAAIARHVADAGVQVLMVGGPSRLNNVNPAYYRSVNLAANSVWVRDYGPMAVNEKTNERILIDPIYRHFQTRVNDDRLPTNIASLLGENVQPLPIIMDGGNMMVDGQGRLFMTERTYDWNAGRWTRQEVDEILKRTLGVREVYALPYARRGSGPADGTGHIDMFAKLLDACTVVVAETQSEPYRRVLEQAASFFASLPCEDGGTFEVYRVAGWSAGGVWYTYTNSLIVNDTIIIPGYAAGNDQEAVRTYQEAAPWAKVKVVNSDDPIRYGGAVHCTTRELPLASGR